MRGERGETSPPFAERAHSYLRSTFPHSDLGQSLEPVLLLLRGTSLRVSDTQRTTF